MKIKLSELRQLIYESLKQLAKTNSIQKPEQECDESSFTYAIASAAKKGEKKVDIDGEEFPVKMSKKKAKQITNKDKQK